MSPQYLEALIQQQMVNTSSVSLNILCHSVVFVLLF